MERIEVYEIIDSERDHQDSMWGKVPLHRRKPVGSWLFLMREALDQAEFEWRSPQFEHVAMDEVRKLAATAVACMEQHGVPRRNSERASEVTDDVFYIDYEDFM